MRWLGRTALILLALVSVLAPALWIGRDVVPSRLVAWAINHAAGAEVVDALSFRVVGLSSGHVTLADLRVNRDAVLTAERVRVEFVSADLLDGRLDRLILTGPVLAATVDPNGGLRFGSLDQAIAAFTGAGDTSESAAADLPRLELESAGIRLDGAVEGRVRLDGSVTPTVDGWAVSAQWAAELATPDGGLAGSPAVAVASGHLTLDQSVGGTEARLAVSGGRLARGGLAADGVRGTLDLALPAAGRPELNLELIADRARAAETALPEIALHLRYDPGGLSAVARRGTADGPEIAIAAAVDALAEDGDIIGGRRPLRLDGSADLMRLDALLAAFTGREPFGLAGRVHAELHGRAPLDQFDPAAFWSATVASGGITVRLDDADLPAPATGTARGSARFALTLAAGRFAAETAEPATLNLQLLAPTPGIAGDLIGEGPSQLTLGGTAEPFRLLLSDPSGAARLEMAGPATLTFDGAGTAAVDLHATFGPVGGGWTLLRVDNAAFRLAGIRRNGVDLDRLTATITGFTLPPAGPDGAFVIDLRFSAADQGVVGASLATEGRVESDATGIHLLLTGPARIAADRLALSDLLQPLAGMTARIAASERPVLTILEAGGAATFRLPIELPSTTLAAADGQTWRLALNPLRVIAEGALAADGTGPLRVRFANAAAVAMPAAMALEGVAGDLRLERSPAGARLDRFDLSARRLADQAVLARFMPLSLVASARGAATAAEPDRLSFRATLNGADGAFVLDAEGRHAPASGRGEANLTLFPIRFVPGGLQPADLSPAAAAMFRGASGTVSLSGRVRWPGAAVPPDDPLTLTLADLGFSGSLGTVTGLAGTVALTGIDPLATAPGQVLSADAIDVGIPVEAPRLRFRLEPEGILRLERVEGVFAGGRVHAEDVTVPVGGGAPVPVVLTVENVDAARLAEVIDLEGLVATGMLSGSLPLVWDPATGLGIRQARLTAGTDGGTLRYVPAADAAGLQDSGAQVSLLLDAIRNFVYESFEIEADGRPGEPFDVKLRLRGANPDLFDGHPVALNVTLTGALDQLFRNVRQSLGISDVVRRRLEAMGRENDG